MTHTQRWLSRLSYSFLILGGWLGWQAYVAVTRNHVPSTDPRVLFEVVGAFAGATLGFLGIRQRHRPLGHEDDERRM